MDDFSVFGNAAAVPIIIALTQFLKRNFTFRRKADIISLLVAITVCWGWEFYYTPESDLATVWGVTLIAKLKHAMNLMLVSFATWFSASKSYDLFIGDKKKAEMLKQHLQEKDELQKQVSDMRSGEDHEEEPTDEPNNQGASVDDLLRDILEGKE